ncbi:hypothetical protein EON80_27780, partial [bacterium]
MKTRSVVVVAALLCSFMLPNAAHCQTFASRFTIRFPYKVTAVAFSRDNQLIACGSGQAVHIIGAGNRKVLRKFKLKALPMAMAFSRQGTILFVVYEKKSDELALDYVDVLNGKVLATIPLKSMDLYDVDSIEVSPDGSLLALGNPDDGGQTIVVRVRDHKILKTLTGASPLFS